jgi:muramoyltetrapeptide carboxypeptidase
MPTTSKKRVKPPSLQQGDTVGIIAPASNIAADPLEAGCNAIRKMGFNLFYFDSILEKDLYFAGALTRRVQELEEMFVRDDVKAIVCARGGYGTNYLLRAVNPKTIVRHPKIFVGYSDITTLLTWFSDKGMVCFHGPMAAKDFAVADGVHSASWQAALSGQDEWSLNSDTGAEPMIEGTAEGTLYGGCLSMLVASLGTPYEIQTANTILFIEDVYTKPFQIDRMLMQLKLAGKLSRVKGIIFGEMLDCIQQPNQDYTLQEVILRIVEDLQIPVGFGFRSGHVSRSNITLPIGVRARLTVMSKEVKLEILESATVTKK